MVSINYFQTDYFTLIKHFADKMEVSIKKNAFIFPSHIATGYCKYINLSNGLQCLIIDFTLHQDMYLCQKSSYEEFYTLRFNEFRIEDKLLVKIDNDYIWEEKQKKSNVFLTSSLFDFAYLGSKGNETKTINVLMPKKWLSKYMAVNDLDQVLQKYLTLKTSNYNFSPFDFEYKILFNKALNNLVNSDICDSIIEKDIMRLVEKFLNELSRKFATINEKEKIKISPDEVRRLMDVESFLLKDFSKAPPSISELSKVAAMSTTSLKSKFKKMYGNTLFEYFQKSRMQRAKVLILTHKYTIKEIGFQLGYSNLSNFTIAFKKEFNRLPSQFLVVLITMYNAISR